MTQNTLISDPVRLDSLAYWKANPFSTRIAPVDKITSAEWRALTKGGVCPLCEGYRRGTVAVDGGKEKEIFCLCSMIDYLEGRRRTQEGMESNIVIRKISDLVPFEGAGESLKLLKNALKGFVSNPVDMPNWFYIFGETGSGKTHILSAIKGYFGPAAFYISAEEFQSKVLNGVGDGTLKELIETINTAPIFLFDDYGLHYKKNSEFFLAQLTGVINTRLNRGAKFLPVIMTSNISIADLISSPEQDVRRLGSRMADGGLVQVHELTQSDYRVQAGRE